MSSGEDSDFCTTSPDAVTSAGNCDCACEVRNCVSTWSVFGSVLTSKFTVMVVKPALELTEYM